MKSKTYVPAARSCFERNPWSDERRAKQAEAIWRWKPWDKSTGPRTPEGRAKAGKNGKYNRRLAAFLRLPPGKFLTAFMRYF